MATDPRDFPVLSVLGRAYVVQRFERFNVAPASADVPRLLLMRARLQGVDPILRRLGLDAGAVEPDPA
eukprot:10080068-Lingulodinium_polyedra.AAC.1